MANAFGDSTEFTDQTFESVDAKGEDLNSRRFENCFFTSCSFSEASLRRASFVDCKFIGCDLSNVQVTSARFRDVKFLDSKLLGINWAATDSLSHLKFQKCILNYSVFESLDLRKSIFEECSADRKSTRLNSSH